MSADQNLSHFKSDYYSQIYKEMFNASSYDLKLPAVTKGFKGERLLCVFNYPMEEDVSKGTIGYSSQGKLVLNILDHINKEQTSKHSDIPLIAEYSFISYKDFYLSDLERERDITKEEHKIWVERLIDYIKEYKPTRIWLLGDVMYKALYYHHVGNKNLNDLVYTEPFLTIGRVFDLYVDEKAIPCAFTIPAHLTGTTNPKWIDTMPYLIHEQKFHLEELLYGKNRYTITNLSEWQSVNINTIEEFDSFYTNLSKSRIVCVDLETATLFRKANTLLTIHFSLDGKKAYNLPLLHRQTPFTGEEQNYILDKLRQYFQDGESDYLIFHNAKFDVSVLMGQLDLKFFNHKIFDTIGARYCLSENAKFLTEGLNIPVYNLRHLAHQYGCPAYEIGEVSKDDRGRMAELELSSILKYGAKDVIIPYQIHKFQIAEAERRGYKNWIEFVVEQLGAMVLVFSRMEVAGILVDASYLQLQMSPEGEVSKLFAEVNDSFRSSDKCRLVNEILVTKERAVDHYGAIITSLKGYARKLKTLITKANKPVPVKRTRKKAAVTENNLFPSLEINQGNPVVAPLVDTSKYQELITFLIGSEEQERSAVSTLDSIRTAFNKTPQEFTQYSEVIKNHKIKEMFDFLLDMITQATYIVDDNREFFEEMKTTVAEMQTKLLDIDSYLKPVVAPEKDNSDWVFNIARKDCQQLLFFHVLGLEPTDTRKDGGGKTNKEFQAKYADEPEVKLYDNYTKYKKLLSTYIEGMHERLFTKPMVKRGDELVAIDTDSTTDGRLRADYDYKYVVTGRSGSRNPNFQNLPSHGAFSKFIKRQFIPDRGCIYIKGDLNAAEVRMWGNVSRDQKLADVFKVGFLLRKRLFLETDPEKIEQIKKDIKGKGDVHRINYSFFFGKAPEEVTDVERGHVKGVIFGTIYGMSEITLAETLKCSEQQAGELVDRLFDTYDKAGDWLRNTREESKKSLIVRSPIGRVRHLGSYLHPNGNLTSGVKRKAVNSCIQGLSSDSGYQGGRIFDHTVYHKFVKRGFPLLAYQNNTVHDSIEALTKIEHLPIALYVLEHSFTTLVIDNYRKIFGFDLIIEPELECEISAVSMGGLSKFEWSKLPERIRQEIDQASTELGYNYTKGEVKDMLEKFDHNYKVMSNIKKYEIESFLKAYEKGEKKTFDWCVLMDDDKVTKLLTNLKF